ncbi:MAG: MoxR family ATPase [Acidobacteriota bacterium]|nr:MoxR family ATPase [Acidobacteriota bacterium]
MAGFQAAVEIDGVRLFLAQPVKTVPEWVGRRDVMLQLMAAWSRVAEADLPLYPRLLGKPGVGKTTLACAGARELGLDVYVAQATMDTRPEDLLVSPVLGPSGEIHYRASPLVTAMIRGGAMVLDEGNRMSEKSWASLAPLLDHRRYVESVVAGIRIDADPEFRFVTTMNEDASTYEVPEYIHSRLMPQIYIDFPAEDEERQILESQVPFAEPEVVDYVLTFLRRAHEADLRYTVRDGINLVRYAMKVLRRDPETGAEGATRSAVQLVVEADEIASLTDD